MEVLNFYAREESDDFHEERRMTYFTIEASPFYERGIFNDPDLPDGVSCTSGSLVDVSQLGPLHFESNCDAEYPPRHYMGGGWPVWSAAMIDAFRAAGIDNFQVAPAVILGLDGARWDDYFAVNILGLVSVADLKQSQFIKIAEQPSGLPFASFQSLVIDSTKARDSLFFRMAENPLLTLIHARTLEAVNASAPANGWGFLATEVKQSS